MYAAPAGGALVASLTSGWTERVHRHGRAIMIAAAVWGAAIVAFGLSGTLWPALGCLALAGGADAVSGIFRMTMWNQTIPDALRGRLASIEMVSYSSGPLLGHVEAGAVAAAFGAPASVISGGALCIIGVLACASMLPRFLGYDARRPVAVIYQSVGSRNVRSSAAPTRSRENSRSSQRNLTMASRSGGVADRVERVGDVGIEEDAADFVEAVRIAERLPELIGHAVRSGRAAGPASTPSSGRCL